MNLDLLVLFMTVADVASFSAAAKRLGIPKSSVSRGIARLEAAVGTQLLHRTTRQVSLSSAGVALYERATPHLTALRSVMGSLPEQDEQPSGDLRITAPNDVGATLLAEVTARFTHRYPLVHVEVQLTNRVVDIVAEGFDLALRAAGRQLKDSSLVARRLSPIELRLFAAPTYLARCGTPKTLEEAALLHWVGFRGQADTRRLGVPDKNVRITGDDYFFVREVLRAGAGIGILPSFLALAEVASGQLANIIPRHAEQHATLVLLRPKAAHVPRKVTAFRDFLVDYLTTHPVAVS